MSTAPLETRPSDEQKHRLEDWLTELKIICARYRLALAAGEGESRIIDIDRDTTIALGLTYLLTHRRGQPVISAYDCTDSILDGVWLIDTTAGTTEQRHAGPVFPAPQHQGHTP